MLRFTNHLYGVINICKHIDRTSCNTSFTTNAFFCIDCNFLIFSMNFFLAENAEHNAFHKRCICKFLSYIDHSYLVIYNLFCYFCRFCKDLILNFSRQIWIDPFFESCCQSMLRSNLNAHNRNISSVIKRFTHFFQCNTAVHSPIGHKWNRRNLFFLFPRKCPYCPEHILLTMSGIYRSTGN